MEYKTWVVVPNVGCNSFACRSADASANLLDNAHQRVREKQGPRNGKSKLCPGLRIRSDAARIIICGAGDESRP